MTVREDASPPESFSRENDTPTFGDLVRRWRTTLDDRVDLADSTLVAYRRAAEQLQSWGRTVPSANVQLADFVRRERERGLAPRTIRLELTIAGIAFRHAREAGWLPKTRTLDIPRLKIDPNNFVINHHTPSVPDVARTLRVLPDDDWRRAIELLARTGARLREVVYLRGKDLDEPGRRLALGAARGASKTGLRWFPLDRVSLTRLKGRSRRGAEPLLDLNSAAPQGIQRRLSAACKAAGVTRFTPHGLRRMVVNRLIRARVDPATAASLTGHSVQVMLKYYREVSEDERRAAVDAAELGYLDPAVQLRLVQG